MKKKRPSSSYHDQILAAVIIKIRKKRARGRIEHAYVGSFGCILKGPIPAVLIQPIWKASGLADVKVVKSVAVDITHSYSVVPVEVDSTRRIQDRTPIVRAEVHLIRVGTIESQGTHGDISERPSSGSALSFVL